MLLYFMCKCDLSLFHMSLTLSVCLFFVLLPHFIDFSFFVCLFPVSCPLLADWALCCMLVVMSQFEYSQTVSRTMGIQVNKGKVNPLTHNHVSSSFISQRRPATLLTHIHTRFPFHGPNESGREWASSTNTESCWDGCSCLRSSIVCDILANCFFT